MPTPNAGVAKLSTSPTLSDQAYAALRDGITTGRFPAGQRLTERGLAEELGVSPTPVREALQRLEHERLIVRDAVRNIRVADPSAARLYELNLIEAALRGVAARLAAERATQAEAKAIEKVCGQAEALLEAADLETRPNDMLMLTRKFHLLVDRASHNDTLIDMIATAGAFDLAFRMKWSPHAHQDRASVEASLRQHRTVATAITSRDCDLAESAMRDHVLQRSKVYLQLATGEIDAVG